MTPRKEIIPAGEGRALLLQGITEKALLATVVELAEALKLPLFHVLDTRNHAKVIGPGWPDVVIAIPPYLYVFELKSQRGRISPDQQRWLDILAKCRTVVSGVLRPSDLDELQRTLEELK